MTSRGVRLDCLQTTSEEEAHARSHFKHLGRVSQKQPIPMNDDDDLDAYLATLTCASSATAPDTKPTHDDPFTRFVIDILARALYEVLPAEPADMLHDPPAVYRDKTLIHESAKGAHTFKETLLVPHITALSKMFRERLAGHEPMSAIHATLRDNPALLVAPADKKLPPTVIASAWSLTPMGREEPTVTLVIGGCAFFVRNSEARGLRSLHVLYHFERYIHAVIAQCVQGMAADLDGKSLAEQWRLLATDDYYLLPIFNWPEGSMIPFVDWMGDLCRVWISSSDQLAKWGE